MKWTLLFAFLIAFCSSSIAQEIKYINKNNDWDADSLGNHRVVLTVENTSAKAITATINWRRNDEHVEDKAVFVVDSATNRRLLNVSVAAINRETCTLYFEPV